MASTSPSNQSSPRQSSCLHLVSDIRNIPNDIYPDADDEHWNLAKKMFDEIFEWKKAYPVECQITGGISKVSATEGELLGQVLSVEVLDSSTHNEPGSFKETSLPCPKPSHNVGDASQHLSRTMKLLFEDSSEGSEDEGDASQQAAAGKMSKRTPDEAIKHKRQTVSAERGIENGTTIHSVSKTCIKDSSERENSAKDITFQSIREHFGRPLDDAAKSFGVSRSTFKRICRDLGITRWRYGKRRRDGNIPSKLEGRLNDEEPSIGNFSCLDLPPVQNNLVHDSHTNQDLNKMTVKATYNGVTIRFELPVSSGIAELENNVIERLHLERENYSIKYQDDEGDWILIACDKDVQDCLEISRSLNKTTIKMLLDPPVNHYAP